MKYDNNIVINNKTVSLDSSTYFIADIAANHDGDLERAKNLIWLAKESGADAAKFQHFLAKKIVSDFGFKSLGSQKSHQSTWQKSVFEIYKDYECNRSWTEELVKTAKEAEIDFFTSPYDLEAIEMIDAYVCAYKIGSGDITWTDIIEKISTKGKPVLLATGASNMEDVQRAVNAILKHNSQIALMQCNTNYTGSTDNFKYVNLKVLHSFAKLYPGMILGLSDHTPGHSAVLGAIALGARVVEKHFTDDNNRIGPDHPFSLNPVSWREMIDRSRELEAALGDGIKRIENNEQDTVVLQRRSVRLVRDMSAGEIITKNDLEVLRPAPEGSFAPYQAVNLIGKTMKNNKKSGDSILISEV